MSPKFFDHGKPIEPQTFLEKDQDDFIGKAKEELNELKQKNREIRREIAAKEFEISGERHRPEFGDCKGLQDLIEEYVDSHPSLHKFKVLELIKSVRKETYDAKYWIEKRQHFLKQKSTKRIGQ